MIKQKINSSGFGIVEILLLLIILLLITFGGYYVYYTQKEQSKNISSNSNKSSTEYVEGYRGGASGVKLKIPVDTMAKETLLLIKNYYEREGVYPESETSPMIQALQDNGYNAASAGGSLKCPDYNGYFSYTGFVDDKSGTIKTFKLYYCDGPYLIEKNMADLEKL